ncbi:D-cysteine desulfhydrase [Desulfobotulus sp. H1]|uniref:D-cysteine desulfhydrase n=1 Tax=Desulfobotulus pelophilus TaxID=2823377 RepID=A0ABT3N724_9BACT|nr:D-cysteine desulfhydrase [Desulfobotulus pelophilus]MCW7753258.1 D-cysteine desulfhydrase [Desulfobotulus pelophilus]
MNLSRFPRRRYTEGHTPLEFLPRFTEAVGGPNIYIKRDDLLGLTSGGNKTRKLEFLVADAMAQGADTLITCGAVQSNHCRLTLAAAVKEGLKCRLVLEERVPGSYNPEASGNNFLFNLLGVEKITVVPAGTNMAEAMGKVAEELAADGRRGYVIPGGGSNAIGATGYVACAQEIQQQLFEKGLDIHQLCVASGSSGTHAGLLTGFIGCNLNIPVVGVGVSRDPEDQDPIVHQVALETAERLGMKQDISRESVVTFGDYWRPKYSVPNAKMVEAVTMMARTEGILLDPVYTGKAVAGLIGLCRKGYFKKGENVLYVHTGGSPALYAYTRPILGLEEVAE